MFKRDIVYWVIDFKQSFNLLSEILFVQARGGRGLRTGGNSFNLLSEILFVQAKQINGTKAQSSKFQSLERDSVCSSDVVSV